MPFGREDRWRNGRNLFTISLRHNPKILKEWFELYMTTRAKYGVADEDIYNMDEKGFAMGIADSSKVIVKRETTSSIS